MNRRIVFMARDAGAAAAIAPLARRVVADGRHAVAIVGHGRASAAFEARGLPVLAFDDDAPVGEVEALLLAESAAGLITGTSMRPARDGAWWEAARRGGIPSVAVLDHWCNYAGRFSDAEPFDHVPDAIAVMDDVAAGELTALGCPERLLRVTGQPYFDDLARSAAAQTRTIGRQELGVAADRLLVVFASEPQARYYGAGPQDPGWLGYTEADALAESVRAVAAVAPEAMLVVKLHPLEDAAPALSAAPGARPEVRVLRAFPPTHLIAAADVVLGMTSIFLLEAAVLGVPTVSVRPGGGEDHFIGTHARLIPTVTEPGGLPDLLRAALARGPQPPSGAGIGAGAIEQVLALLEQPAVVVETGRRAP